jgi:hypothetical protein
MGTKDMRRCGAYSRFLIVALTVAVVVAGPGSVDAASLSLSWNAPTTNVDGTPLSDLGGYRVYLATTSPACPGASFLTVSSPTTTPAPGQTIVSRVTGLSAGATYFMRVTAVDTGGRESPCSDLASGVAQPDFTVTPSATTSFGSLLLGSLLDRTFTVQNTSTAAISVGVSVGAPFSIVSGGSFSLAPGASRTVTVRFLPTIIGSFAGNVNFTANGDTVSRGVSGSATLTAPMTLSVTKNGTGAGTVTSTPAGIACGTTCTHSAAAGTQLTLAATAASGSTFVGWGGACSGTAACVVTLSANRAVTATFNSSGPSVLPAAPGTPSVTQLASDASGVTFAVAWAAVSGAASYGYVAGFSDGSATQQGTVTGPSFQLRMPYHASGAASDGFVCLRSINAAGQQSTDQSCNRVPVPARPAVPSNPAPVSGSLSPASAVAGSAAFTLTLNGSGFVASSVVRWNGATRTTTFVSATQLRAAIAAADLATVRTVPVSVFTPAPGGGTSGTVSFMVTASPPPSTPPAAPGSLSVTQLATDAGGVTFAISWTAASGAVSYRYVAGFGDGSAAQQGTVTGLSFQLRMPYHVSGSAFDGFVCVRSINAAGQQSIDQSCNRVPVPER